MAIKMIDPNMAASLYAKTSNVGQGMQSAGGGDEASFAQFLKQGLSDSISTIKQGEKTSAQAVMGQADITEVVQAVTNAEVTLQTVIAVRDRLVGAFQEIMRMPI
jgi:flagellar hook-basal body complex protein FliE